MGGIDIWDWAPVGLSENKETLALASDPLAEFIANGDDYCQIIHSLGHTTTLTALSMSFAKHMEKVHRFEMQKLRETITRFWRRGTRKPVTISARVCNKKIEEATCGDPLKGGHYYASKIC